MIKKIAIYNRFCMDMFAKTSGQNLTHKRWYLISIYGDDSCYVDGKEQVLFDLGCVKFCSLLFWDITDKMYGNIKNKFPHAILFNDDHAKTIVSFLEEIKKDDEDSDLVVHCSAGISRSGAVGTFACDYFGLDYNDFLRSNPYIMANQYVLSTLRKVDGITPHFGEHDGIDHNNENGNVIISRSIK